MSDEDERDEDREDEGETAGSENGDGESAASSEAASDAGSDDDGGDDDAGGASDTGASDAVRAPATPPAASAKTKAKSSTSAGARLAAAKAAKAAAKAAKKQARKDEAGAATPTAAEREQEDIERNQNAEAVLRESPLGRAATTAADWAAQNRQIATGLAALVIVVVAGWLGWSWWTASQAASAGELLSEALEISSAEIVSPDAEAADDEGDDEGDGEDDSAADDEQDAPTFESVADRNEAALVAYRRVSSEYPSAAAAAWARLGEGRILLAQGENEDARTAYQAAFDASNEEPVVAWQALEGLGASYEAESDWEHATAAYERLASLHDHAYENVANYHLARMRVARGETSEALSAFRELVDALQDANEEGGEPEFPYVLAQADERLRELDPSAAGAGPHLGGGGGGTGADGASGLEDLSPEQLQELIRRLQAQSAGGGGDAPAPE